jgi:hypothetical protein
LGVVFSLDEGLKTFIAEFAEDVRRGGRERASRAFVRVISLKILRARSLAPLENAGLGMTSLTRSQLETGSQVDLVVRMVFEFRSWSFYN